MTIVLSPELLELRRRVRQFVDERVIPAEPTLWEQARQGAMPMLDTLRDEARALGLFAPHLPVDLRGNGLGLTGMCALFQEMGRSLFGPRAFHCDAPDQGNMDLLALCATPAQRQRYLVPLAQGSLRSAFCMTEPAPGAGADPRNLRTEARLDGGEWVLDGHKWFATGGMGADFFLVMARTSAHAATLFLVDGHAPGVERVRQIPTMAEHIPGHDHAELRFHGVRLPAHNVLGQPGDGFRLAQLRLVPARLTHCMRWLGLADRALGLCRGYLTERVSFGAPLAQHQLVADMVARSAMELHAGSLMVWHCADRLEKGDIASARGYSSMAKLHVARALCDILDRAIQMHGAKGYSDDLPFGRWYRFARAARIADGPDEVHVGVISRDVLDGRLLPLVDP
jgi:acyl-CoA dehydrogenase